MKANKFGLTKETISICEELLKKYNKPIKINNVVSSIPALLSFYNSTDVNGKKYIDYMDKGRMLSLLYQSYITGNQKDEIKEKAARMINNILDGIVVN